MKSTREKKKNGFLLAWIRGSVILQMLDRLSERVYRSFGEGFFGWLFTGYVSGDDGYLASFLKNSPVWQFGGKVCRFFSRQIEESLILTGIRKSSKRLLRYKLRTFGFFTATYGLYTAAFCLIRVLLTGGNISIPDHPDLLFSMGLICFSLPLLLSKVTLCEALCDTPAGEGILRLLGYMPDQVRLLARKEPAGRMSVAFICGIACGVMTFFISPWWIPIGLAVLLYAYLVLCKPEIGVLTLFFAMPFFPTMLLAGLVIYIFFCFVLKLLRGKRSIHVEPLDVMVMAFAVVLFCGGTVSLSSGSLKPALLFVCFLMGYFEVVWLLRERQWLMRCSVAGVLSASLTALYGIFQYVTGSSRMAEAWVDKEMFDAIGNRVVGTLENPNMFGEYLILMIPLALLMLVGYGEGLRRLHAFVCLGIMGVCLIMTWSRGAWLGLMFALVVFLFIWHRRAVWMLFAGVASIPLLPYILPESIIQRFTSIGNLSDSSTSYRVFIWRAACDMVRDHGWTGIGIGESAWDRLYPKYMYMGVEAAPHSHNLFLQIWLETGIFGLLIFLLILFLLCQSLFTLCRQLQEARHLTLPEMRNAGHENLSGTAFNRATRQARTQIRMACAAPLTGVFAVLVQGMTDYAWYNYRVYLMFWLMIGLTSAYIRSGREMIMEEPEDEEGSAVLNLPYRTARRRRHKKSSADGKTVK